MNLCRRAVCGNVVPYSVLKKYAERCADNVELDRQTRSGTSHFCKAEIAPFSYRVCETHQIVRIMQIVQATRRDVEGAVPYMIVQCVFLYGNKQC